MPPASTAQPLTGSASMLAATDRLSAFCWCVARAAASGTGVQASAEAGGASPVAIWSVNWPSAKLPLAARPGPCCGSEGCASASSRTAVMPGTLASAVSSKRSCSTDGPETSHEPSACRSIAAPPSERALVKSSTCHFAGSGRFVRAAGSDSHRCHAGSSASRSYVSRAAIFSCRATSNSRTRCAYPAGSRSTATSLRIVVAKVATSR